MFTGLKQNHKVIREKDTCPKFCDGSDLRFQAQRQVECYLPLSNGHHRTVRTGNNKKFVENFDLMKHVGLSWPVLEVANPASHRM